MTITTKALARLAEKGDAEALCQLGYRYALNRQRSRPNWGKAAALWQKAAKKGHTSSRFNLGVCFYLGYGVKRDRKKAAQLYYQAADDGHVAAHYNLALMYRDGIGVKKDLFRCMWLLNTAALLNHVGAQRDLGYCLYTGLGVPQKDMKEAAYWYRRAAKQGDAKAQWNLALCYLAGEGVRKNSGVAKRWLKAAASKGYKKARRKLREIA